MPVVIVLLLVFSVSKAAFVANTATVLNKLTSTIKTNIIIHDDVQNARPAAQPVIAALKTKRVKLHVVADTAPTTKTPVKLIIRGDSTAKGPKPVYVVDGHMISDFDIKAINPDKIATINIAKSADGVGGGIVYIITKDNPAIVQNITGAKLNGKVLALTGGKVVNGNIVATDTVRVVRGYKTRRDTANSLYGVRVTGVKTVPGYQIGRVNEVRVTGYGKQSNVDLSNLSNKLFIINGKTSTEKEMRQISMFDIDHIAVKNDEETKSLYGDKAKNGVVFIVTKKK